MTSPSQNHSSEAKTQGYESRRQRRQNDQQPNQSFCNTAERVDLIEDINLRQKSRRRVPNTPSISAVDSISTDTELAIPSSANQGPILPHITNSDNVITRSLGVSFEEIPTTQHPKPVPSGKISLRSIAPNETVDEDRFTPRNRPTVRPDTNTSHRLQVNSISTELSAKENQSQNDSSDQDIRNQSTIAPTELTLTTLSEASETDQPQHHRRHRYQSSTDSMNVNRPKTTFEKPSNSDTPQDGGFASSCDDKTEWPDPVKHLFGINSSELPVDEPVVFCIDHESPNQFIGILETLGVRLYRERVGGTPETLRLTDAEELADESRWVAAEDKLLSIALDSRGWEKLANKFETDWYRIWENRICDELFGQEFGVIILNRATISPPSDHFPNVIRVNPSSLSTATQWEIAEIFTGCFNAIQPTTESDYQFSQRFNWCYEQLRRQAWQDLEQTEGGLFVDATSPDASESRLHRRMKAIVVKQLVTWLEERGHEFKTPEEITRLIHSECPRSANGDNIRPDVLINQSGETIAYEIETLFAQSRNGFMPRDKIRRSFTKYERSGVDKVQIILDNLSLLLHLPTIGQLQENYQKWCKKQELNVEFLTLDLDKNELLPVESIREQLNKQLENEATVSLNNQ